jgi:hypothetical protein
MAQRLLRRGRSGDHETTGGSTSENAVHAKFVEFALSTSRAKTVPGLFYLAFVAILVILGQS